MPPAASAAEQPAALETRRSGASDGCPQNAQVPLLTVLREVAPVRVPGRLPLYQVWFDIQPETFEGDFKLEGADIKGAPKVCPSWLWRLPLCTECF